MLAYKVFFKYYILLIKLIHIFKEKLIYILKDRIFLIKLLK